MSNHVLVIDEVRPSDLYGPTDPEEAEFEYSIECPSTDGTCGWQECWEQHLIPCEHDDPCPDPSNCEEPDLLSGDERTFHGIVHTYDSCYGWTIPWRGCVVEANLPESDPRDFALDLGCGRWEVDDDWENETMTLTVIGPAPDKPEVDHVPAA